MRAPRQRVVVALAATAAAVAVAVGLAPTALATDATDADDSLRPHVSGIRVTAPPERVVTTAYTTGYTWFDNTPAGSALISNPVLHRFAGGTGTFDDPITVAVGHSLATGADVLDYPAGTRFYLPHVRRYFIVEDTCGDGPAPQNGACHSVATAPRGATTWLDVYIGGGSGDSRSAVQACAGKITDADQQLHPVLIHPDPDYLVVTGPLFQHGHCTALYPPAATRR